MFVTKLASFFSRKFRAQRAQVPDQRVCEEVPTRGAVSHARTGLSEARSKAKEGRPLPDPYMMASGPSWAYQGNKNIWRREDTDVDVEIDATVIEELLQRKISDISPYDAPTYMEMQKKLEQVKRYDEVMAILPVPAIVAVHPRPIVEFQIAVHNYIAAPIDLINHLNWYVKILTDFASDSVEQLLNSFTTASTVTMFWTVPVLGDENHGVVFNEMVDWLARCLAHIYAGIWSSPISSRSVVIASRLKDNKYWYRLLEYRNLDGTSL